MNKQGDDRLFLECERWRVFAVLMVAAGFLGAFTYTLRGGVFCNAQTGNFLLMAIELADGNLRRAPITSSPSPPISSARWFPS